MTAGLQVINDSYTMQIDDQYANLRLIQKGTLPAGKNVVTVTGNYPLVVVRLEQPTTGGADLWAYTESCVQTGNSWSFTISTTLGGVAKDGMQFEYYIFDSADPRPSTFGLQTFNAAGKLVYDSNEKYLKVVSQIKVANFRSIGTIPVPAGRKYGLIFGRFPGKTQTYYQPAGNLCFTQLYTAGMNNISGGLRVGETWFFSRTNLGFCSTVDNDYPEFTCLVIDLTGI